MSPFGQLKKQKYNKYNNLQFYPLTSHLEVHVARVVLDAAEVSQNLQGDQRSKISQKRSKIKDQPQEIKDQPQEIKDQDQSSVGYVLL